MGKNEGPLGRFHLALIQVFSEPLTRRTTVHCQCEKWSPSVLVQTNVQNFFGGGGHICGYWTNQWAHAVIHSILDNSKPIIYKEILYG